MGIHNITGWSGGGRRPLTYNLQPGQFRNTRVNLFPNQTIINNNIGNFSGCYDYYDSCCCGGNDKTPSWMNWMMGLGMGTSLLGGILNMFGIGGAKETEGAGGKEKTPDTSAKDWVKSIKTSYPNANLSATPDGRYLLNGKIYDTPDDVLAELGKPPEKPADTTTPTDTTPTDTTPAETPATDPFTMQLFKGNEVSFKNAEEEEAKFKELTGKDVFKLDSSFSEITIDKLIDKGGPKDWDIKNVEISKDSNGKLTCKPEKIGDKVVSAEILGKDSQYIRLKVGDQTYIVGNDGNGYQYENGNVEGYSKANWRGSRGVTPPPTASVTAQDTGSSQPETGWKGVPTKLPDEKYEDKPFLKPMFKLTEDEQAKLEKSKSTPPPKVISNTNYQTDKK